MATGNQQELQGLKMLPLDQLISSFPEPPSNAPQGKGTPAAIARLKAGSPRAVSVDARRDDSRTVNGARVGSHDSLRGLGGGLISINMPLLLKGVRGELSPTEQHMLHGQLLNAPPNMLESTLEKAYKDWEISRGVTPGGASAAVAKGGRLTNFLDKSKAAIRGEDEKLPTISLSKSIVDFGQGVKIGKPCTAEVVLTATGGKPSVAFRVVPHVSSYSISFSPAIINFKKEQQKETVTITLTMRSTRTLAIVLTLDVESGGHYFIAVKAASEKSAFGAPLNEIDLVDDNGLHIPAVLVVMKRYLYDQQGLNQEGIFRLQGNEEEMNAVKDQLNRCVFSSCKDINAIACLIKQWFRDMPQSIFVDIPPAALLNMPQDPQDSELLELIGFIKEPYLSLFTWLMDLLADVASMESVNRMSARNLAIVISPNLFGMDDQNALDAVLLSQKIVIFVQKVLTMRMKRRYGGFG